MLFAIIIGGILELQYYCYCEEERNKKIKKLGLYM